MIFMEPSQLGWDPLVISWMNNLPEPLQSPDNRSLLLELFHWLLPPTLRMLRKHCRVSAHNLGPRAIQTIIPYESLEVSIYLCSILYTYFFHTRLRFRLQEVVPTSNSNTVVSLCRLFEMLLTEPVKTNPGDKNIRTWIMVKRLSEFSILKDIITLLIQTLALYLANICTSLLHSNLYFCTSPPFLLLYNCRQLLPSPWCGPSAAAVTQTAERSLVGFSERLCLERQKNILSPPLWGNGSVQWMRRA